MNANGGFVENKTGLTSSAATGRDPTTKKITIYVSKQAFDYLGNLTFYSLMMHEIGHAIHWKLGYTRDIYFPLATEAAGWGFEATVLKRNGDDYNAGIRTLESTKFRGDESKRGYIGDAEYNKYYNAIKSRLKIKILAK